MGLFEDVERKIQEEKRRINEANRREVHRNGGQTIGEFCGGVRSSYNSSSSPRCSKCGCRIDRGSLCGACSW